MTKVSLAAAGARGQGPDPVDLPDRFHEPGPVLPQQVVDLGRRAGRQVTLVATGVVLADASGAADGPFKATLTNLESTQY